MVAPRSVSLGASPFLLSLSTPYGIVMFGKTAQIDLGIRLAFCCTVEKRSVKWFVVI